ncbi:MAG: glycosyltransferase family 4 protein [Deltaproteobacteria bacterium]|nr:glycosyltransferase family 4 protein [Deltaproteobacteria bacterium]
MNIYINARFLTQNVTGVQRYAIEISKRLKKLYPNTLFISPKKIMHKDLMNEFNGLPYGIFNGHLWEQIVLPHYLKKVNNPLLVNLGNTAPLCYKKQIITIFDLSFLINPEWFSKKFYYYYQFLIPKIAKNSLKIITISEFSKKEIIRLLHIPEQKIKVIYCGVDTKFRQKISVNELLKNRPKNYILSVLSLEPRKNIHNLILAFKKIGLPDIQLILVGSRSNVFANNKLKDIIHSKKNIFFTGYLSDDELIRLYSEAKLFVYPSYYEGFGLPPLEAMACGCPVVVSNAASLPEVCGDAAQYIDPYNVESIAEGINKVLTDEPLRQSLIEKGLERARLFSWEKSAQEHIEVFEEVVSP